MTKSRIQILREYAEGCDMFTSLLLELPDEELVNKIMQADLGPDDDPVAAVEDDPAAAVAGADDADKGLGLISAYKTACAGRDTASILQEIAVDRTRLLAGLTKSGPRPPYASLYLGASTNDTALSVVATYRAGECSMAEHVKNAPDHLGVEISFISELCEREAAALEQGDETDAKAAREIASAFMREHLGSWAPAFADEMFAHATTDLYRGVALLLKRFIEEGKAVL